MTMAIVVIEIDLESQIKNMNKTGMTTTMKLSDPILSLSSGSCCGYGGLDFKVRVVGLHYLVGIRGINEFPVQKIHKFLITLPIRNFPNSQGNLLCLNLVSDMKLDFLGSVLTLPDDR